ncbi:hypothetical protein QMT21_13195 [Cronobacter sakazakii]|nr:hypothetical protein [Cronobacter sakazakii]
MWINKKSYFFLFLAIAAGTVAWWYHRPYPPKEILTSLQEANMQEMLKEMKTRCIGRYLIDLPASFSLNRSSVLFEDNYWVSDISMADDLRKPISPLAECTTRPSSSLFSGVSRN